MQLSKKTVWGFIGAVWLLNACGSPDATTVCYRLCDKIVECSTGTTADACRTQAQCQTANDNPDKCKNFDAQIKCVNDCIGKSCDQAEICLVACPACEK